jgi:mannosyltransferase OCH1-like enzyme
MRSAIFVTLLCLLDVQTTVTTPVLAMSSLLLDSFDLSVMGSSSFIENMMTETKSICGANLYNNQTGDKIPHHLWIAVKDNPSSYLEWPNIKNEIEINPSWSVHICDNIAKDLFMETFFPNTSLLESYRNINPVIAGAAKADIWRYAMLFVFGGVYIDSDSQLRISLNEVIKPADEMILAFENNHFDGDWCATRNVIKKNPQVEKMGIFKGRILTNWCLMSAPGHIFLSSALETFVKLSRAEFLRLSNLKISQWDPFSKYVYCSTGPSMFTASARKVMIESSFQNGSFTRNKHSKDKTREIVHGSSTYRLASKDFGHEGGVFKAVRNTKADENHYSQIVPTKVCSLLFDLNPYCIRQITSHTLDRYYLCLVLCSSSFR